MARTALAAFALLSRGTLGQLRGLQHVPSDREDAPHAVSPAEQCSFVNEPEVPYYWDPECNNGQSLGCWADGVHAECRFCGEAPYTGLACPSNAVVPSIHACDFDNPPVTPVFWDETCHLGMKGCNADGKHLGCRFCGEGNYTDIECPAEVCSFPNEPLTPYYWDSLCQMGMLGCNADGIHAQCRFCAKVPFQSVPCPEDARPPYGECWFPTAPDQTYYWDDSCEWGELGCWADGVHAECRFCGGNGAYAEISCPSR